MNKELFQIPISFHIFNRPELTRKVFEVIKKIKPSKIFITADGPRKNIEGEEDKCMEVKLILNEIDWECDIFKNFSEDNKGSYKSTSEGITWVFKHVDSAIILEDDCIPHISFFRYCQDLLNYYKDDKRIAAISGNNFQPVESTTQYSYDFSRYALIWGWATWKESWNKIDFNMQDWPKFKKMKGLDSVFYRKHEREHWYKFYQDMYEGKSKPHWDFQFLLSCFMNNAMTILPNKNLVTNVGFGVEASNNKLQTKFNSFKLNEIKFPLDHPSIMCRNVVADDYIEKLMFTGGIKARIKRKIISFMPKKIYFFLRRILVPLKILN